MFRHSELIEKVTHAKLNDFELIEFELKTF
jgi:hypothetical protein